MYAAGYSIRPLRSRREAPLKHLGRWSLILLAAAALALGLSKVALGDTPTVVSAVVVQPGDTLWGIAAARYPGDDVRVRIDQIERLNRLQSPRINAGEVLQLPG
ncbi:MAG TPA: LysM peptidoglycan-binding domain-containing protein [Candidatus Micrarchaeaceae archaeon]|nr:LysM peptidoglycan-binding domain-containing protein [Candidatus Micrarchaeaceae archaeon]